MIHTEVTSGWVYEHYLVYLYLCVADVDCLISNEELNCIQKKAFNNLDNERCAQLVSEVFREYRSHSEEERKLYVKENVSRFLRTKSIRQKVIENLASFVPQSKECLEQVMYRYIRRIINSAE